VLYLDPVALDDVVGLLSILGLELLFVSHHSLIILLHDLLHMVLVMALDNYFLVLTL